MNESSPEIILALDLEDRQQIKNVLDKTDERLSWVKVGLQSFLRDGTPLVHELADSGKKFFWILNFMTFPTPWQRLLKAWPGCLLE